MRYIIAIGIFQAILAAILLQRSRLRSNADGLLLLLIACIGVHLSIKFFIFTFVKDTEVLTMLNTFIGFCYLPLLYLYVLKTIHAEFIPASKWYVFIPFIIASLGYFSTISVLAAAPQAGHFILHWYNTISLWSLLSFNIIFSGYVIYIAKGRLVRDSNEKKLIIQVASLFLIMGILGIAFTFIGFFDITFNYVSRSISYAIMVAIIIRIISYKYINFTELDKNAIQDVISPTVYYSPESKIEAGNISLAVSLPDIVTQSKEISGKAIRQSHKRKERLAQSEMFKILLKLENAMKSEQLYADSELTLDKLAKLTNQKKYHISETLNHFVHKPFYTFVNEYRVQHVKDKLEELSKNNIDVNILELAYESGFNSKSSFNRYFKEITLQTPSEYFSTLSIKAAILKDS